jgi:hypothetical protein
VDEYISVAVALYLYCFSCDAYLQYVICKCLSWDSDHQRDLSKAKLKNRKDSVCFEKGVRMDSFTAVLQTLSYSTTVCMKYSNVCEETNFVLISNDYNSHEYVCV